MVRAVQQVLRDRSQASSSIGKSWGRLAISIFLFISLGLFRGSFSWIALLVVVIFIHESGHFIGMKLLKYKDVQMFFIPLFGAAVSGQETAPSSSRKAVVSLLGPVPGILIGIGTGVAYLVTRQAWLMDVTRIFLLINTFNLLPFHPLDGGQLCDALIFSRHPRVEIAFKVLTAVALGLIAYWLRDYVFGIFAFAVFMSLRGTHVTAATTHALRQEIGDASQDAPPEPPDDYVRRVMELLKARMPTSQWKPKLIAVSVASVWQRLRNRPCRIGTTIGLIACYLVCTLLGIMSVFVFEGVVYALDNPTHLADPLPNLIPAAAKDPSAGETGRSYPPHLEEDQAYVPPTQEQKRWALATAAILTESNGRSHDLLGGCEPTPEEGEAWRESLAKWWGDHNREDLLETLEWIRQGGHRRQFDEIALNLSESSPQQVAEIQRRVSVDPATSNKVAVVLTYKDTFGSKSITAWDSQRYAGR
jgi:Zn-dependent protease